MAQNFNQRIGELEHLIYGNKEPGMNERLRTVENYIEEAAEYRKQSDKETRQMRMSLTIAIIMFVLQAVLTLAFKTTETG